MPSSAGTTPAGASTRLRWAAVGALAVVVGLVLLARPFSSLTVLRTLISVGLLILAAAALPDEGDRRSWRTVVAAAIAALAVVAAVWPGATITTIAWLAGVGLVVEGVAGLVSGLRRDADERFAAIVGGLAGVVFGVLALAWPDVTILVVAVVFGARLVMAGLQRLWWSLSGRRSEGDAPRTRLRRFRRGVGAVVSLAVALGLLGLSVTLRDGEPVVDAFYDAPDDAPDEPGVLLRDDGFDTGIVDGAEAHRILYTTTRADGSPAVASALIVVPADRGDEPLPVIAWSHGTTGVDRRCAPSLLRSGLGAGAFYLQQDLLDAGWALVATDYIGLGTEGPHPYLIGEGEGRSVLDAVRAAQSFDDVELDSRIVVWGHSQGGHGALWTGQLAPSYAPELDILGVAALAPASDLVGLVDNLGAIPGGSLFASYVVRAYVDHYDDVELDDLVRPEARPLFEEGARRCLDEPSVLVSILGSIATGMDIFSGDIASGPLGDRLRENIPTGPIEVPLLIGQGADDQLVLAEVQRGYVESRCDAGQPVDFRVYEGRDHVPLVEPDSPLVPELIEWTQDRFEGAEPTPTC